MTRTTTQTPARRFRRPTTAAAVLGVAAVLAVTLTPSAQARLADKPVAPPSTSHQRSSVVADGGRQAAAFKAEKTVRAHSAELSKEVAGETGGSYLTKDGELVVTVTSKKAAKVVRDSGHATPELVDDTTADLDGLMDRLNKHEAKDGAGSVQGWRVDTVHNAVVVTVSKGAKDAKSHRFVAWAKSLKGVADLVVEESPAALAPTTTANLNGGLEYAYGNYVCSTGFNAVDSSNRNVFLTAGHCLASYPTLSRGGYLLGTTRSANFPGDDFAVANNNYPTYWVPRPWVDQYNGYAMIVKGSWGNPPVGATVCKSGRTTGWTCGVIRSFNQTVNYPQGAVYQLVRHNACVEGGDSGGSNISSGGYALGLTSGASSYSTGAYAGKCLSKVPGAGESVSYYQPIAEALTRNGLRLLVG
jgi:hypothetical protein